MDLYFCVRSGGVFIFRFQSGVQKGKALITRASFRVEEYLSHQRDPNDSLTHRTRVKHEFKRKNNAFNSFILSALELEEEEEEHQPPHAPQTRDDEMRRITTRFLVVPRGTMGYAVLVLAMMMMSAFGVVDFASRTTGSFFGKTNARGGMMMMVEAATTGSGMTTEATVAEEFSPCDASTAPKFGDVGDCTANLVSGESCQPVCNDGYTVSGPTKCVGGVLQAATCEYYFCNSNPAEFFSDQDLGESTTDNYFCAIEDTEMTVTLKPPNNQWLAEPDALEYKLICPPDRTLKLGDLNEVQATLNDKTGEFSFTPDTNAYSGSKLDLSLFSFSVTRTVSNADTGAIESTEEVVVTGRIYIEPRNDRASWPSDVEELTYGQQVRPSKLCTSSENSCANPWGEYTFETFQTATLYALPTVAGEEATTYILRGNLNCIDASNVVVSTDGFVACSSDNTYDLEDLDADNDILQYVITTQPQFGQVKLSCDYEANNGQGAQLCGEDAGAFVYIPFGNNTGSSDMFEYVINDMEGGGHNGLDPPTGLPVGTRGANSASRRVKITVAEKSFLPSIEGVKEVVTSGGSESSTTANIVEDTNTKFTATRANATNLPYESPDGLGAVEESHLRVYIAQNDKYFNITGNDVNGYETVKHGRIKWECWDEKCAGNVCAQEHTGTMVNIDGQSIYTCDCDYEDGNTTIFAQPKFWQTCSKNETTASKAAYFTYEPTPDVGGVQEELWMRTGVEKDIIANFNHETATVLINVDISQVDDGSQLGVYSLNDTLITTRPHFTAPMTAETIKEDLTEDMYASQWQAFKIKASDDDTENLFITLVNADAIQGMVTHFIPGVKQGDPTMGKDPTSTTSEINVIPMGGSMSEGFFSTLYYRAKEYWRGPMETLRFAVSQTDEWESAQSNYQIIEITFITNCARGHKKNALETECSPCGPGQFANAIDTHSCSACDKGTFAEGIGSAVCDPCSVTSFQPSNGKSECKACPMLSSTEGGAIALGDCMCDVGAYGRAAAAQEGDTYDSTCKSCASVSSVGVRCIIKGMLWPEAMPGYFIDIPDNRTTSLTVRKCTPEKACHGNATFTEIGTDSYPWTAQCAEGYEDKGCAQCVRNSTHTYYRLDDDCMLCPDTKWESYLICVLMLVGFIMVLPMLVKLLRRFKAISLLFVFVQITAVLSDLDFNWPPIIQNLYKYFAIFTFDIQLLQPECHIPKFDFFSRYFVVVLSPLVFGGTFVIITLVKFIISHTIIRLLLAGAFDSWFSYDTREVDDEGNRRGKLQRMKERAKKLITDQKIKLEEFSVGDHIRKTMQMFIRIMLTLMDISYIFLSRATLEYFDCVPNEANGLYYLEPEPSVQCYDWGNTDNTWTRYFPIAMLLVCMYPFGIVITFYFTLYRIRDRLNRPDTVKTYGFLYVGYRPAWYRYKILVLLRQLGVVASTMIWSQGTTSSKLSQSLGCLMTIFIAMTIHFFADPQESKRLDRLESAAIFISFVNIFSGLIFLTGKASERFDDFLSWFNAVLILGGVSIFLIYITMEVTPFAVKAAKGSKGISGVLFGDIKKFDANENKKTTRKKLEELDKRLSKKISVKDEKQKSLEKGPSLYRRMTLGSKRDIMTPEELRAEARSKFVNAQLKEASKQVLDKTKRAYLQELPVEEDVLETYRTEYVNPETMDKEFTELDEQGVDIQAQWIIERHLPAPFTRVQAVDILKRVSDLLDRSRKRQKSIQGVNMLGSLKPSGLFALIRKGVISKVSDNLMRIRLTSDDGPNKIVSKVVPLATEKSKSGSLLVKFYNWAMGRLGFSVAETASEKKKRTKAAFRNAMQKQKGAGVLTSLTEKKEGDGEGKTKKPSLLEKIKAQQKLEEEQAEAAKKAGGATSKPETPPEAKEKEQDAPSKQSAVGTKPSALERLRSVAGGRKKEEKDTKKEEKDTKKEEKDTKKEDADEE